MVLLPERASMFSTSWIIFRPPKSTLYSTDNWPLSHEKYDGAQLNVTREVSFHSTCLLHLTSLRLSKLCSCCMVNGPTFEYLVECNIRLDGSPFITLLSFALSVWNLSLLQTCNTQPFENILIRDDDSSNFLFHATLLPILTIFITFDL